MSEIPQNAPSHCPGTQSEDAGKASACAGCPNQNVCASGVAAAPDPAIEVIRQRLSEVKHKILVLSGKGGVGKSTTTAMLGYALAATSPDINVGILDADICGPSQPRMLGVRGEQVHRSGAGWSPVYVSDNLCVMSIGFLLGSPDDAVIWRGPKKNGMIKQFLSEVDWGDLDYLLIDTPPGTSDEHLSCVSLLSSAGVSGAILVTTPQELAHIHMRKEATFCRNTNIPVLGVLENMCGFVCPTCQHVSDIFPPAPASLAVPLPPLGSVPLDPALARSCDDGQDYTKTCPDSNTTKAFLNIANKVVAACEQQKMS